MLVWDGLSSHWSRAKRAWLQTQQGWLSAERLPPCAPELRAVELANFAGDHVVQVADQAQHGIQRVCASESLVVGFLAHTGPCLDQEPSP